jgi:hypothetical protein
MAEHGEHNILLFEMCSQVCRFVWCATILLSTTSGDYQEDLFDDLGAEFFTQCTADYRGAWAKFKTGSDLEHSHLLDFLPWTRNNVYAV